MTDNQGRLQGRLLTLLLQNKEQAVSGESLSEMLGVTRGAVWKEIAALRQMGYGVEAATRRGYRLIEIPDLLTAELVGAAVKGDTQQEIICLPETDSTNLYANRLVLSGAADGTVVIADRQTNGMGRMGRSFESPGGQGIYLSMILEPHCTAGSLGLLTSYAGLAVCAAIEESCGVRVEIKWPNDIIIEGKKVCGILTRLVSDAESGTITHAIVGIGVNVRQQSFSPELADKAVSLWQACGRELSRAELAGGIINHLNRILRVERWLENPPENALTELRERSCTIGRRVVVDGPAAHEEGEAVDIDPAGGLVVRFVGGTRVVSSGEVSVRGVLGYS